MVSSGVTGLLLITALTGAVMMTWIAGYLQLSASQAVAGYLIMLVPIGTGVFIVLARERPTLVTAARWSPHGADPEYAAACWNAVVRGIPRTVVRCFLGGLAGTVPAAVALVAYWHEPAYAGPPLWAALATGGAAALVISTFGLEIWLRPIIDQIAARLPADFEPEPGALRLRTKALAPLPVVAFYGALAVGAFADVRTSGSLRLLIALAIATATVGISALVFFVITRSALAPLDELLAATERVRVGDLGAPVPVVTADDLGHLARSFNLMLEGLRERESLRHHNERLTEALRASLARVVAAADAERRRAERDLHDGAQQQLTVIGLKLSVLESQAREGADVAPLAGEIRGDLSRALAELRDLAHGIYPAALETGGLPEALNEAVQHAAIPAALSCEGTGRHRPELEAAVYFCCLEGLQNVAKHAGSGSRALVSVGQRDGWLQFEVSDDGHGFDPGALPPGAGIQNMSDRIGALGGELRIFSEPGVGTTVSGTVPATTQP